MRRKNQTFRTIKNKIISIVCMIVILLTNMSTYAKVLAYEKNDHPEITVKDEDIVIMDDKNLRKTESMENINWLYDSDPQIGNIEVTNGGKTIKMIGNESLAGKNAIYVIPETPQKQIFQFDYNIDFGDSFDAAGVLMKVQRAL